MRLRIGLVLSLALIGGFAAWVYAVIATPTYTARAYLATAPGTPDAVHYAHVYAQLATGGPVLAQAATLLGPDPSGLDRVTASTSGNGPVIQIEARNTSARRAAVLADAVARALAGYGSQRLSEIRGGLSVVAPAGVPARPSSPSRPRDLLIGGSAGLLAGALAALLTLRRPKRAQPVRPTFDDPAEIAGHLGIWRAQYGGRSVTAYRSAAASADPDDLTLIPEAVALPEVVFDAPTEIVIIEPAAAALNEPTETFVIIEPATTTRSEPAATTRAETAETAPTQPAETAPAQPANIVPAQRGETGPAQLGPAVPARCAETEPAQPTERGTAEPAPTVPDEPASTVPAQRKGTDPDQLEPTDPARAAETKPAQPTEHGSAQPAPTVADRPAEIVSAEDDVAHAAVVHLPGAPHGAEAGPIDAPRPPRRDTTVHIGRARVVRPGE